MRGAIMAACPFWLLFGQTKSDKKKNYKLPIKLTLLIKTTGEKLRQLFSKNKNCHSTFPALFDPGL